MGQATIEQVAPPPAPAEGVGSGGQTGSSALSLYGIVLAALAFAVMAAKVADLRRDRDRRAVAVQAAISDALLSEATVLGIGITATAHVPLWRASAVTIDVIGRVSTAWLREMALRIVDEEARRMGRAYTITDRIAVSAREPNNN
jgi:hypothetical protein